MTDKLFKESFALKDTQCTIISDSQKAVHAAIESIKKSRQELEIYVRFNPAFLHSLTPLLTPEKPLVAKLMAEASQKAQVGPMAAVAGAIADLAVEAMKTEGCQVAVVENGGEIMAISNQPIDVAMIAGDEPLSKKFGFRLTEFPIAVATSSGRFSHAFSFGNAEAATVFCKNAALADSVATAVCNLVKDDNPQVGITNGLNKGKSVEGVEGVLILYKGQVGTWGKIPEIIKIS